MGKKRSRAQRIGVRGENEFRRFAERHHLIANKVEQDFGTDFLCQVERRPDRVGTAQITGALIGAFVRTTSSRRARVQIDRDEAHHLLSCEYPIAVVLVHDANPEPTCHARFVDVSLATALGRFLLSDASSMTVTPTLLAPEDSFDEQLRAALVPSSVEKVRLALASTRIQSVLPKSRVQVRRTGDGSFTLVQIDDFFSQYEHEDKALQGRIYSAVFGHERHFRRRLGNVPVRKDLLAALERLPRPVVIGGPINSVDLDVEVVAADGEAVMCSFEVRKAAGYVGWIHESGFAITLSESTQHEGNRGHFLRAHADPDVDVDLADYEDLWRFLAACRDGASLRLGGDHLFPVANFTDLPLYGFFANYLTTVTKAYEWPRRTWLLSDGSNQEVLMTLGILETLVVDPERLSWFGYALVPPDEPTTEELHELWVPIVMNLPRAGLVAWIRNQGTLLKASNELVGFRFGPALEIRLDLRAKRFPKSRWPEVVHHPAHWSVPMVPSDKALNANRSNAKNWECGFLPGEDEPVLLGRPIELQADEHRFDNC